MSLNLDYFSTETHKKVPKDAVVLDLKDAPDGLGQNQYQEWLRLSARADELNSCALSRRPEFLRWIADQIEAQTKPPRIPEPGLWGVVRGRAEGQPQRTSLPTWVRVTEDGTHPWHCAALERRVRWDDLIDPVLVREGTSE